MSEKCGCVIVTDFEHGYAQSILYCSLHASAEKLRDALVEVKKHVPLYWEDDEKHQRVHAALDMAIAALAAAQGQTK